MNKFGHKSITYLLLISLLFSVLTGCSMDKNVADQVKEKYPLESVNGSGKQSSYVYRAAGQSVQEVAASLSKERKPEQQSKASDEHMFLVYPDEVFHIQKDTTKPKDSLIEVDSKEYVQKNYSPGFLEGYLLSSLINNLFGKGKHGGEYQGYATRDIHKPNGTYHTPTPQEKKQHPPLTVNSTGSITKRSKNADTTPRTIKGDSHNPTSDYGNKKWWHNGDTNYSGPKLTSRSGKITRRRR